MKKMSWGKLFVFVLSVSLLAVACSKPKDGTNGTNGAPGPAGTANVIYSAWTDVTYALDVDSAYEATIVAPKLVDSILQKGEMKVYINAGTAAAPNVIPLPYFDGGSIINVAFALQKINLISTDDFSTFTSAGVKHLQYRYILIPGGTAGRSVINWNDYEQVKLYFGLKD